MSEFCSDSFKPDIGLIRSRIRRRRENAIWYNYICPLCGCPTELCIDGDSYTFRERLFEGCINCRHTLRKVVGRRTKRGSVLIREERDV